MVIISYYNGINDMRRVDMVDKSKQDRASEPVISVIIPVYKVEKYIHRCVDSVLAQTFTDFEVILVDDSSPDDCGKICDAYAEKDDRIRVIHQVNQGVGAARNHGISLAAGEYLYFIDSDDYMDPASLEILLNLAEKEGADYVIGGHHRVEPDGSTPNHSAEWPDVKDTEDIRIALLRNKIPNFVWGRLSKKSLWKNLAFPAGLLYEDMYITAELSYRAEKIAVTKEPLYYYSNENVGSIMNYSGTKYIRLKYGQFLAWKEHEKIALEKAPKYAEECACTAGHAAIRAYMLNEGAGELTEKEKGVIYDYLKSHDHLFKKWSMNKVRTLILHHNHSLLSFLGAIQRKIVNHQQERRRKRKYKK